MRSIPAARAVCARPPTYQPGAVGSQPARSGHSGRRPAGLASPQRHGVDAAALPLGCGPSRAKPTGMPTPSLLSLLCEAEDPDLMRTCAHPDVNLLCVVNFTPCNLQNLMLFSDTVQAYLFILETLVSDRP